MESENKQLKNLENRIISTSYKIAAGLIGSALLVAAVVALVVVDNLERQVQKVTASIERLEMAALDFDEDGFPDDLEQAGFSLYADPSVTYPPCDGAHTSQCVDWQSKDLFIVLEKSPLTLIEEDLNPFEYLFDLDVMAHVITSEQVPSNRQVTQGSSQVAIWVEENTDRMDFDDRTCDSTSAFKAGETQPIAGPPTPGTNRISWIFTRNIVGHIDEFCQDQEGCIDIFNNSQITGAAGECDLDDNNVTQGELDDLDRLYIKHTIAHEAAHSLNLGYDSDFHHRVRKNYIMEEYVKDPGLDKKNKTYEWTIPTVFCDACQANAAFF